MIRITLAFLTLAALVLAWRIAESSSPATAWLFVLAVAVGFMLGVLATAAWMLESPHAD